MAPCIGLRFFREQFLNALFQDLLAAAFLPIKLTIPPIPHVSLFVDEVHAGPHGVTPRIPVVLLVID